MANTYEAYVAQTEAIEHSSKVWKGRINAAAGWTALTGLAVGTFSKGAAVLGVASMMEGTPGGDRMEQAFNIDLSVLNTDQLRDLATTTGIDAVIALLIAAGIYVAGNGARKVVETIAKRRA